MGVPYNLPSLRQVADAGCHQPPPPLPPPPTHLLGSLGRNPLPPLHRTTPFPRKLSSRIDLGENLVLASKSGSEVMVRA